MEELEIILEKETNEEKIVNLETENSGGTGGTSNYNDLENKPSINGVKLVGNKTTKDLGIEAGKEVHIGAEEPTGEEKIWIDPNGEADKIPTKTSELENDSGFIEDIGTFYTWEELEDFNFKQGTTFLFNISGALASYGGTYIGQYSAYGNGTTYYYRYISCCNMHTLQSLTLDILYKNVLVKQMNIQDTNDYFTSDGLDDILQEIGGQLNGIEELLGGI